MERKDEQEEKGKDCNVKDDRLKFTNECGRADESMRWLGAQSIRREAHSGGCALLKTSSPSSPEEVRVFSIRSQTVLGGQK